MGFCRPDGKFEKLVFFDLGQAAGLFNSPHVPTKNSKRRFLAGL
jgi:hypothetical protein